MDEAKKRFEEQLARWFKANEAKGYSEDNLKLYLIEHGYHAQDITESLGGQKRSKKTFSFKDFSFKDFDYKSFFSPTFIKLFFPAILLLLIILSFVVNSLVYPKIGGIACNDTSLKGQYNADLEAIKAYSFQNDADPLLMSGLIGKATNDNTAQDELLVKSTRTQRTVVLTDFYLYNTGIYHLNPFFPTACDPDSQSNSPYCYDYFTSDNYACMSDSAIVSVLSSDGGSQATKTNAFAFIIDTILLVAILYLFVCIIYYFLGFAEELDEMYRLYIILGIVLLLVIFILTGVSLLSTLMMILLLYSIMMFIREDVWREVLLTVFAAFMLLIMFMLFFIANSQEQSLHSLGVTVTHELCNSTKLLEPDEILTLLHTENPTDKSLADYYSSDIHNSPYYAYTSEPFNVCKDPDCNAICINSCLGATSENPYSLRGTTPSCVCTCEAQ